MDPLVTPRRAFDRQPDPFGGYMAAVGIVFIALAAWAQPWKQEAVVLEQAEAPARLALMDEASPASVDTGADSPAASERGITYICDGATGLYRQNRPCPAAAEPLVAPPPRRYAQQPDPNQALLDAADARYAREVQRAREAGRQLDRQLLAARVAENDRHYSSYHSCTALCDEKAQIESDMRRGYSDHRGQYLRDRMNAVYRRMQQADCRACMR